MMDFYPVGIEKFYYFFFIYTPIESWLPAQPRAAVILLLLFLSITVPAAIIWFQVKKILDNLLA